MLDGGSPPSDGLAVKAASGLGWNLVGFGVRAGAGFVINVLLARLLGPEPFGLIAIAMAVIALGNLLVDSGLSIQLIRAKTVTTKTVRGVFTLQMLLGLVLATVTILSIPLIAALLKEPTAGPVLRALAFMLVIVSAGQTSTALLRRDLRFKAIQKIQVVSYLIGYGAVGIPLAYAGAGVWTLVWAQLIQTTLGTIMSWVLVRHSLRPYMGRESASLFRLGSLLAGSNVMSWSIGAMPSFIIGRTLGAASLGLYNRASMLVGVPLTALVSSLQTVSLSLYSRLQEKQDVLRRTFLGLIALVAVLACPAFSLVSATSGALIQVVLGQKWAAAAPVLVPLAFAMCFDAVAAMCSPLLISRGRPDLDFRTQLSASVSGVLSLAMVAWMGCSLATLAWTVCISLYLVRALTAALFVRQVLHVRLLEFARPIFGGLLLGAVGSALAGTLNHNLATWPASMRLILSCGLATAAVLGVVFIFPRATLTPDLVWLISGRGLPIPSRIDSWLRSLLSDEDQGAAIEAKSASELTTV